MRSQAKRIRELESGWTPSSEESAALEQLNTTTGTIEQLFARLQVLVGTAGQHRSVLSTMHGWLKTTMGMEGCVVDELLERIRDRINAEARRGKN